MIEILKIIETLSDFKSPSGFERGLAQKITEAAAGFADEVYTDTLGNLIVRKKGRGKRLMLSAHMDTAGFLATHIDDYGFVRFGLLGDIGLDAMQNANVVFINDVRGVVSCDEKVEKNDRNPEIFYIDIGAYDKEHALNMIKPGDAAVFDGKLRVLNENRICAPYLENRIGCALLLYTLRNIGKYNYDLYFVFTVLDETGLRGSKTAAYSVKPDFALSIGVTLAGDTPGHKSAVDMKLGKGCAIKVMDKSIVAHPDIVKALTSTAEENSIAYQSDIVTSYGTPAGAIHLARGGIKTGGIGVPIRYRHTPCEIADLRDVADAARLISLATEQAAFI
jgi:endoglucanase